MARTFTSTKTYARLVLIQINVKAALGELGWDPATISNLVDVGLANENRWIVRFDTYAHYPGEDNWVLHFQIAVDWNEHGRLVVETSMVDIDDRWTGDVNPALMEAAKGFAKIVGDLNLEIDPRFDPHPRLYQADHADELKRMQAELHSTTADSPKPAGAVEDGVGGSLSGIGEVSMKMRMAFRDEE